MSHLVILYAAWLTAWAWAVVLLVCGIVQLGRAARWEMSPRSAIGLSMIAAAGLLGEALRAGPPHAGLWLASAAFAASSVWLVWVPHKHPVLERVTTGFGELPEVPPR